MGTHKQTIEIDAIIKTSLQNLDQTMNKLQGELKSGKLQLDLTKGVGKDLSKLISNFQTGFSKIKQMTPDDLLKISDSKEFQREGAAVVRTITEIQRIVGDLGTKNIVDAKKIFPNSFDTRVTELLNSITKVQSSFETLGQKQAALSKVEVDLQGLTAQLNELDQAAGNKQGLEKMATEANNALNQTKQKVEEVRGSLSKEIEIRISQENLIKTKQKVDELDQKLKQFTDQGVTSGKGGKGLFQGKGIGEWQKLTKSGNSEEKAQAAAAVKLLQDYNKINTALREQQKLLEDNKKLQELMEQSPKLEGDKALKTAGNILGQKDNVKKALEDQARAAERAAQAQQKLTQAENAGARRSELTRQIAEKTQKMNELNVIIKGLESGTNLSELAAKFYEITNINVSPDKTGLTEMTKKLKELDATAYDELVKKLQELGIILPQTKDQVDNLGNGFDKAKDDVAQFNDKARELDQLKNRIKYFFGLTNSINLFKRAIRSALNTVKELDATMTEAAVVTDFSVGDMWDKLPTYAKEAQKLGVSINSMYQATTLYYQQGLKTNEAMALGVETMKMARIAGMESADATKAMTAALRGFNMELNEMSATRVNDVYSQLAAVTAADTNQIATAMSKTASIAASANMEFETTAALLAQIIETTQEAPETAGTAMKTIIARFSEVKSLRERGETTGKDEEGETIDVNKIQTALRSVGISMEGFFAGTEGLDSILLKLAEKWGTLDVETQRYIATMAAGSRQQSRFLAMMSDYGRTMELVSEAENSAGASQKQFEKTQDSLATSLTRLKNAYDQFLMSLANNEILKFGIDLLTKFIETVNKMIDAVSGNNGLTKSLVSLLAVIGSLKGGGAIFNKIFGEVAPSFGLGGKKATQETITEKRQADGNIVRTIVKHPTKEGEQAGQQAGTGFVAGFKRAIEAKKQGLNLKGQLGDMFTLDSKKARAANAKKVQELKTEYLASAWDINQEALNSGDIDFDEIIAAYDKVIQKGGDTKQAAIAANDALLKMGGSTVNIGLYSEFASLGLQGATLDMNALGQAALGVGGALGLLSTLFENLGWDKAAETTSTLATAFMGLGTIMMILSSIAPMMGVSFTTAGIMIGEAGAIAQIPWLWVFAVVAAAVTLFSIFKKKKKKNGLEEQMKKAAEATQKAKEAAQEAKQAYDNLANSRNDYDDLQNKLENLTEGTLEWKRALVEVNSQVLDLINKYPDLKIQKGEYGQLIISDEDWDKILEKQLQGVENANAAVAASRIEETELEKEKIAKDSEYTTRYETRKQQWGVTDAQLDWLNDYWVAVDNSSDENYQAALQAWWDAVDSLGIEGFNADKASEILVYRDQAISEGTAEKIDYHNAQNQVQGEAIIKETAEDELSDESYGEEVISAVAQGYIANRETEEENYKKKELGGLKGQALAKIYAETFGVTEDKALEIVEEDKEGAKDRIAKAKIANQYGEKADELGKKVGNIEDETGRRKIISALISGDYSDLTLTDFGLIKSGDYNLDSVATQLGMSSDELLKLIGIDSTAYQARLSETTPFEKIKQDFAAQAEGRQLDQNGLLEDMTYGQVEAYANLMTDAHGRLKPLEASNFQQSFDNILSGVNSAERGKILELASTYDFSREGAAEDFLHRLDEMGIKLPADKVKDFTTQLGSLESNIKQIDLNKLITATKTLLDLADDLATRDSSEGITDEEYNTLIENDPSLMGKFAWDGQNWIYLEGSLSDLARETRENTGAILENNKIKLEESIARGREVAGVVDKLTTEEITRFKEGNMSIGELRNLFGNTLEDKTDAEVRAWYADSRRAYSSLAVNEAAAANWDEKAGTAQYMGTYFGAQGGVGTEDYNRAIDTALSKEGVQYLYEQLREDFGEKADEYDDSIKALTADLIRSEQAMDNFNTTIGEVQDSLVASKRGTAEYSKAWDKVKDGLEEVFGPEIVEKLDISEELMEGLASGSKESFEEVARMASESAEDSLQETYENFSIPALQGKLAIDPVLNTDALKALFGTVVTMAGEKGDEARAEIQNKLLAAGFQITFNKVGEGVNAVYTATVAEVDRSGQFKPSGGGGGGGGSKWENPYDEFYNTVAKINEELRTREKIELRYQRLLDRHAATAEKLAQLSRDQITSLETERADREYLLAGRERQMRDIETEYKDLDEYARYNEQTRQVEINWDLIEKLDGSSNEKLTSRIEEYISKLEEQEGMIEEEIDALDEIQDAVWEIYEQGKEDYLDLEDQIKEAIIGARQREIDKLSEINDSINDTNSKLIDSMQKQIDQYRQNRENQRTEEEISDKQRRLAYLQQDTSGANALEIMKLQEEIDKAQEDYTDTLIDQKISELQDQNDQAAEQRQKQIDIMQAQLDKYEQSGQVWQDVHDLMREGLSKEDGLMRGSKLEEILKGESGFEAMSHIEKMNWLNELESLIAQGLGWLEGGGMLGMYGQGATVTFKNADGQEVTGVIDEHGNVIADGQIYSGKNFFSSTDGKLSTTQTGQEATDAYLATLKPEEPEEPEEPEVEKKAYYRYTLPYGTSFDLRATHSQETLNKKLKEYMLDYLNKENTYVSEDDIDAEWDWLTGGEKDSPKYTKKLVYYKTGGLADFTGPAWLDGTKSRPEYVLNADQTKSFFQLVDVLSSLRSGTSQTTQNSGDNTYDIDINVESIGSDYDVEQLADTIKRLINEDARYRSNNSINLMR